MSEQRAATPRRSATRIGWALVALYVVLILIALRLESSLVAVHPLNVWEYFVLLWMAVVGAIILSRFPTHAIGRLFIAVALSFAFGSLAQWYAVYAIVYEPGVLPAGEFAAWVSFWITYPGVAAVALFLPLYFPDGRLPSERWRPVQRLSAALLIAAIVFGMIAPDQYGEYPNVRNPIGLDAARGVFEVLNAISEGFLILLLLASSAALFSRLRNATVEQRLQIRWFAFAVGIVVVAFLVFELARVVPALKAPSDLLALLAMTALPTAAGVAILRYRLYDIDIIVNRTVVYVALTAVLAGLYTAAVALFQRTIVAVTGESSDLAIVLTLFVLATVFTPIKNTLQSSADKYIKPVSASGASLNTAIDDLVRLAELHARGILTDEEFAAKKKQVLKI